MNSERTDAIRAESDLMYLVIGALYNSALDHGETAIKLGSPTWDVLREIVNRVEGWE